MASTEPAYTNIRHYLSALQDQTCENTGQAEDMLACLV